jgi:peptidoglycan/xylan/chitin deacetylase (PgdA/CDA1 family)
VNPYLIAGGAVLAGAGFSARWNWWRPVLEGIPILMYHKIGDPPPGSQLKKLWVSKDKFREQMNFLKTEGYHPIVFKDLYQHWDSKTDLPSKPILITFDDGYANNFTEGFPILKEFGFPATIFVVVQTVGWDNRWHDPKSEVRINMISWAQIKELRASGWEIGSHTMNHYNLQKIDLKEAVNEIEKSRQILTEFLGEVPDTFAYPYGSGEDNETLREKVKAAGYRLAVGVHAGKWTEEKIIKSPFNLPRVFVRGDEFMFDFRLQVSRGRSRF